MLTKLFWGAIFVMLVLSNSGTFAQSIKTDTDEEEAIDEYPRTPLYMLLLLMIPDSRDGAGWDAGPSLLAGARVALKQVNTWPAFPREYRLELIESREFVLGGMYSIA